MSRAPKSSVLLAAARAFDAGHRRSQKQQDENAANNLKDQHGLFLASAMKKESAMKKNGKSNKSDQFGVNLTSIK